MSDTINIAVVGVGGLKGEAFLAKLAEAGLDFGKVFLLADAATAGEELEFGRKEILVTLASDFDFTKVQQVVFVGDASLTEQLYTVVEAAGCAVVDASGFLGQRHDISLATLQEDSEVASIVAIPEATTLQLWFALQPLLQETSIVHLHASVMQCAAQGGKTALEDLGQQTAQLLNFREVQPSYFDKQLAFNLLPQVGELLDNGETVTEGIIREQLSRLLVMPPTDVDVTMMWSPVFYGDVLTVSVQSRDPLAMEFITTQWQENPFIVFSPEQIQTPVSHASGKGVINIGRVRSWLTPDEKTQVSFVAMADPVQISASVCVRVLKNQLLG